MKTRRYLQLTAIALALVFSGMAQAQNTIDQGVTALTVGPLDQVSGFPVFVTDSEGVQLGLCLDPVNCVFDPPIVGNTFSEEIGFGAAAAWFSAKATITLAAGNAVYEANVGAAFNSLNGEPVEGATDPSTMIRFRMDVAPGGEGVYTITHPYGEIVTTVVAGQTRIDEVDTVALPPGNNVGPFLTAANAPVGFLGNGVDASTVVGGPNGNVVRIQGPAATGLDVQTDQFVVLGQVLTIGPMTAAPATATLVSGQAANITVTGGLGGLVATSSAGAVATATVRGRTVTITGGATGGTATITLTDSAAPANTATVAVTVTAAAAIGAPPGLVSISALPTEPVTLVLNITNAQGVLPIDLAQEWLVVLIASGGVENLFFFTSNGLVPLDLAGNPSAFTFNGFDHAQPTFFIGNATLGEAGFSPGDVLMFGYAFSTTPVTSFAAAPNLILENLVMVNVQ